MGDLSDRELEAMRGLLGAVGIQLIDEVKRHRAMVKRLEAYVAELDNYGPEDGGTYTHLVIAVELRNRMKGPGNG